MKVIHSISQYYKKQLRLNEKLKKKADQIIKRSKEENWHYFSRIKDEESYALKIESGKVKDPSKLEDFFACTLVVENSTMIESAKQKIEDNFKIIFQRPNPTNSKKAPESFMYEDLRLYVKFKTNPSLPNNHIHNELSNILFEIQIKTFLQHAWTIATHDMIYKGDDISWTKQRIAYQIKAMLEHAEISIKEIECIKDSDLMQNNVENFRKQNDIKIFYKRNWDPDRLPEDMIRLTKTTHNLLKMLKLNIPKLQSMLDEESQANKGVKTLDLSPFFVVVQTIINQKPSKFQNFTTSQNEKIAIPPEIEKGDLSFDGNPHVIQI